MSLHSALPDSYLDDGLLILLLQEMHELIIIRFFGSLEEVATQLEMLKCQVSLVLVSLLA